MRGSIRRRLELSHRDLLVKGRRLKRARLGSVVFRSSDQRNSKSHAAFGEGKHGWVLYVLRILRSGLCGDRGRHVAMRPSGRRAAQASIGAAINWARRGREAGSIEPCQIGFHKPKASLRGFVAELGARGLKVDYRSVREFVHAKKLRATPLPRCTERSRVCLRNYRLGGAHPCRCGAEPLVLRRIRHCELRSARAPQLRWHASPYGYPGSFDISGDKEWVNLLR